MKQYDLSFFHFDLISTTSMTSMTSTGTGTRYHSANWVKLHSLILGSQMRNIPQTIFFVNFVWSHHFPEALTLTRLRSTKSWVETLISLFLFDVGYFCLSGLRYNFFQLLKYPQLKYKQLNWF